MSRSWLSQSPDLTDEQAEEKRAEYIVNRVRQIDAPSLFEEILGDASRTIPKNMHHDDDRMIWVITGPQHTLEPHVLKEFGLWEDVKSKIKTIEASGRDLIEEVRPHYAAVW